MLIDPGIPFDNTSQLLTIRAMPPSVHISRGSEFELSTDSQNYSNVLSPRAIIVVLAAMGESMFVRSLNILKV